MLKRLRRLFRSRLVAISVARDEEDVIEAFVRHTAGLVDHHLIVDHCSHDRTPEILARLIGEGLPLSVYGCGDPIYNQPPLTNLLMKRAVEDLEADWVVPLDVDEFVMPAANNGSDTGDLLRDAIAAAPVSDGCLIYPFRTFHPTEADLPSELNVVQRISHHFREETGEHHKIIVGRRLSATDGGRIMPGNHHFNVGDRQVTPQALSGLVLGHYPVRSLGQFIRKIANAELGKDSFGKKRKGLGTQKTAPFELLKKDPMQFLSSALAPDRPLVEGAGEYLGDGLKYTEREDEFAATIRSLLSTSHQIARQLGAARDQQRGKDNDPLTDTSTIRLEQIDPIAEEPLEYRPRRVAPMVEEGDVLHF